MPIKKVIDANRPIKIWTTDVEEEALQQLKNCATLPFIYKHIACMPDVHAGNGATIGSVIPTQHAVIPAAVGVDLGCGMQAIKFDLKAEDLPNLTELRGVIENYVPHGRSDNGGAGDCGRWTEKKLHKLPFERNAYKVWNDLETSNFTYLKSFYPKLFSTQQVTWEHLGTLGTGNHFIEICLDETDQVWCVTHSGSRGIGNRIGSFFIDLAKQEMDNWFIKLVDKNLAFLSDKSSHFTNYINAVMWAQQYAKMNRNLMSWAVTTAIEDCLNHRIIALETIDCQHNYLALENHFKQNVWVTRKGAIRAREGDFGIIPGSMGARTYIVKGKGNPDSFNSCSHGAGRRMSRTKARKLFSVDDLKQQTTGIECCKEDRVLDEIPGAYKNIDEVMENQSDLVNIKHTLHQIINVKG